MATPTVTVTATLNDPSGSPLQGNSFIRFRLRGFQGFPVQVSTYAILSESQIDALPSALGAVSQNLVPNSDIYPANTYYTVEAWDNGRIIWSANYIFNVNTNLNTAVPVNTPPPPPGFALVLQNNGALNSSQSTLNLENTDGSLTITDEGSGTLNLVVNGGAKFSTAGQGWFLGGQDWGPIAQDSGGAPGSVGVVNVVQLQLDAQYTISELSAYVITGAGSGYMCAGLYSVNGLIKLIDAGTNAFNTQHSQVLETVTLPSAVVVSPGTYWFAWGSTDGNGAVVRHLQQTYFTPLFSASAIRYGTAANTISGGALPTTLGAITANTSTGTSSSIAAIMFQV
jgi:hypothetical protein